MSFDFWKKQLFIFDIDGTLVNAYEAITLSLNVVRRHFSYKPVSKTTVRRSVGNGDVLFIQKFFPPYLQKEALRLYRGHHTKTILTHSFCAPGARELLQLLRRRKKLLAVASNRPQLFTEAMLKKFKIFFYFDRVVCADTIKSLKPNPKILLTLCRILKVAKKETVFVGDMDIDMETALRAGIDAVFVKGGSSSLDAVKHYKKKVVSSLRELIG